MTKIPKVIETDSGDYVLEGFGHDEVPGDEPYLRTSYRSDKNRFAYLEVSGPAADVIMLLLEVAVMGSEYKDIYGG